jgi:hypothetical protein
MRSAFLPRFVIYVLSVPICEILIHSDLDTLPGVVRRVLRTQSVCPVVSARAFLDKSSIVGILMSTTIPIDISRLSTQWVDFAICKREILQIAIRL